ncbi:WD40-repeat-containing domain protein [Limtongia smithiae]|uniref:WD40-repeat-containing domain protein n=1 Tax=Limtongia smithiae TaxID=1125753 RepID=UPI0034D011AD
MDLQRCRLFDDASAHAVTALAFSHASTPGQFAPRTLRLAVGRANGDIELWNPRASWAPEFVIKGGRNRSVEGLAWTHSQDGVVRLFSIGGSTAVTEWDLRTGLPLTHYDCDAGIVWSMQVSPDGTKLAAGCDNGSVVVLDVSGGRGSLVPLRVLQRQKARVLSIAWRGNACVVGGCADGRIRVWAVVAAVSVGEPNGTANTSERAVGRIVGTMRVDKAKGEDTLVWSICVLNNGRTIVSGDSTGCVKFWDAHQFALLQSFVAHDADVLCVTANAAADSVFAAGIDRKIVRYSIVDSKLRRWAAMSNRLLHAKDIRAIAAYESKNLNLLISGGTERALVINTIEHFVDGAFRKISAYPQAQHAASTGDDDASLLIASWTDNHVKIWAINSFTPDAGTKHHKRLVASLVLANDENITHAGLSACAKYLAVATTAEVKLFVLAYAAPGGFKVKKVAAQPLAGQGARMVAFGPAQKSLLLVTPENKVLVYAIGQSEDEELRELAAVARGSAAKDESDEEDESDDEEDEGRTLAYAGNINNLAFSSDGSYLAVSTVGGRVTIFSYRTTPPHARHVWTLPHLSSTPTAMSFCPDNDTLVVVTGGTMQVLQFSVAEMRFTPWSRKNSGGLPREFEKLVEKCAGIFVAPARVSSAIAGMNGDVIEEPVNKVWLWGATWVANIDMAVNTAAPPSTPATKRRRSSAANGNGNVVIEPPMTRRRRMLSKE